MSKNRKWRKSKPRTHVPPLPLFPGGMGATYSTLFVYPHIHPPEATYLPHEESRPACKSVASTMTS